MRPMADQTILITGATDGLGKALAAELAATGAGLLLHGRDDRKGADTVREIQHRTANGQVRWYRADLSSLRQTADLAQRCRPRLRPLGRWRLPPRLRHTTRTRDSSYRSFLISSPDRSAVTRSPLHVHLDDSREGAGAA